MKLLLLERAGPDIPDCRLCGGCGQQVPPHTGHHPPPPGTVYLDYVGGVANRSLLTQVLTRLHQVQYTWTLWGVWPTGPSSHRSSPASIRYSIPVYLDYVGGVTNRSLLTQVVTCLNQVPTQYTVPGGRPMKKKKLVIIFLLVKFCLVLFIDYSENIWKYL